VDFTRWHANGGAPMEGRNACHLQFVGYDNFSFFGGVENLLTCS
jgi:hypothetical protein